MTNTDVSINVAVLLPAYSKSSDPRPGHTFRAPRRNFIKGGHERRELQPVWRVHVHQYANAVAKWGERRNVAIAVQQAIAKAMADAENTNGVISPLTVMSRPARAAAAALGIYRQIKNPGRSYTRIMRELERVVRGLPAKVR